MTTGTALVEYKYPQPTHAEVAKEIAERERIAHEYLVATGIGYYGIKAGIKLSTIWDRIGDRNLVIDTGPTAQSLLEELERRSERYFRFRIDLFRFYGRHDHRFRALFRLPMSHATLEEENIEQKFPDDVQPRALMRALNIAIRRNQVAHIAQKRVIQLLATLLLVFVTVFFLDKDSWFARIVPTAVANIVDNSIVGVLAAMVCFALVILSYSFLANKVVSFCLTVVTTVFKSTNELSCDRVTTDLIALNNRIARDFDKLAVTDIATSQTRHQIVIEDDWPERTERVFKLALWSARRLEHLERFWQIQFERLRIFQLISKRLANFSSISLWMILVASTALIVLYNAGEIYHSIYVGGLLILFATMSWRVGAITRENRFSFDIGDILKQEFHEWSPFSDLRYYDRIAAEYRGGKAEIQKELKSRNV